MATLYVGSDQTYKTINAAIEASNPGDTIIVEAGDYSSEGAIVLDKNLTLQAAEGAKVIVDHVSLGRNYNDAATDYMTVKGLTLKPQTISGGDWHYSGVYQNSRAIAAITIKDCIFDFTSTPDGTQNVGIKMSRSNGGDSIESVTITGCEFICSAKTAQAITMGDKGAISSINISDNTVTGGCTSTAIHMDMGFQNESPVEISITGNEVNDVTGRGIMIANVKNDEASIVISGNIVDGASKGIDFYNTCTHAGELTIQNNTISNVTTSGMDLTYIATEATGTVEVTGNDILVTANPDSTNNAFVGYTPEADANTVTVIESAASIIVDASITGNVGDIVAINGKNYIIGTNAFANLTDAVNAASATEATTITVTAGTYNEDITLDARTMEQKGNIKFIAAEGADVTFSGLFTIGYYEKRVGSKKWDADVTFENITFDQAADAKHSIDIQQCNDFTMTNCKVIGDGEYGISGTNVDNGATITGTTFENAAIQSAGNFGTGLVLDDCTFNESRVNIQSGNEVTIMNSVFNNTLTDANVGDSFYCIRSNDDAINIANTTFNIDSTLTEVAADQAKWGVLWQRNDGGRKWKAFNCEFNFTESAMQQTELLVNKNGTTNAANEAGRVMIYAFGSSDNEVADLLAKTEGTVNVIADGKFATYNNGAIVGESVDVSNIYIDNRFTADNVGELTLGVNAFTTIDDKVMATAAAARSVITVKEGAEVVIDKTITNTVMHKDTQDWYYTDYLRTDGAVADMNIDGTLKTYHLIVNNADTVVSTTGRVRTDEDLRIVGGTLTINGNRNGETADELYTGSWGNDIEWTDATQVKISYFKVVYGAEATLNNTNIVVWAQSVDVGAYWTATEENPSTGKLTLNNSYMVVGDWNTITVGENSVLSLTNNSTIQADNDTNSNFRAKMVLNGTLNIDADSQLVLGDMTIGENGKIVIDAADFTGSKKFIDLSDNESLAGKVEFVNKADNVTVIYGADGDVTLTDADMSKLYVNAGFTADNTAEGQVLGINAFTSMVEALKNVSAATEKIEITGDIVEDIPAANLIASLSKDLVITGSGETASVVTLNNGGYKVLNFAAAEGAEDIDVKFENIQLIAPKTQVIIGDVDAAVKAEIASGSMVSAYVVAVEDGSSMNVLEGGKFFSTGEVMSIKGSLTATGNEAFDTASETLTADDRQIVAHYMWNYGAVTLTDTYATIYSQLRLRNDNIAENGDAAIVADNALIEVGKKVDGEWLGNPSANGVGWIKIDHGSITLTNDSVLKSNGATGRDGYGMTVAEGTAFNVESGSTAEFSAGVSNAGTINVNNGTLIVGNSWTAPGTQPPAIDLANNGTIEVSGESTLDIAELTGSVISFADGTTLVDSKINYTGSDAMSLNGVTFKGDNTLNAASYSTSSAKITVAEGGSLTATGGRWAFGGNADWDINGNIENVKALTAEEKAALKASLNVSGLSLSTGGGEAVMNVDNAYVTYGSGAVTTKNTNVYGGKMTLNFTNSYLASGYKISVNPTKAGYDAANAPEVVLNFKDSVVEINNYFTNNHAKGTVTINNTDFTATAFGNTGTFSVANGSKVNFSLVNNALGDWAGKGSLNAGTITVDASDLTIVNKTATLEFYNVGEITLSNGAKFTLDQLVNAKANDLTGSGNINTTFADMAGSITIDATSLLTVTGKFVNAGSITIDGANFAGGTKKVIDLAIDGSLKGSIATENLGEGVSLVYGKDGDVFITDAATEKLLVNSAYADKEFGAVESDKVYGVNAFGSLSEAVAAKTADTTEIVIESDISEAISYKTISGNLVADSDVTITDSANSYYVNFTGVTLDENITVDAKYFFLYGENTFNGDVKSSSTFYSSGKLTLTGNAEVYTTMSRNYASLEDGIYVVGSAAAGEGKNAAVQYKSINYLGHYSGTFSVKDTAAEFGYILLNGSNDGDIQAQLVLDNAKVSTIGGPNGQPGQVMMNDDATIIATNDSVLDFRGPKDFGYISMTDTNSISLTDSTMYLGKNGQGTNTLAGTITLKNSTLNSLGTLNSNAAITIDATSSIVATAITGGTITIDAKGYTGDTVKVVDVDTALGATVTLKNAANNYYLTYEADGDVILNKSPEFVYVSSDYNSSTEGWGVTKFANYDSAVNFIKNNARKATMVIEKTITLSGNCFADNKESLGVDLTNTVIVKDGAVMGNAQSKWDMTYAVTIEGGGILQSARPATAGIGNTHIKNKLTIGDGSDKQAKVLFINGKNGVTYQTMSIALLSGFNRSLTANNALIEVGDLGINAAASFTDTTLTIEGILAIKGTSLYKTTMTDTEVTIKGHNLMNENTYYSTVGTILATLTMDNSSIVVDDGNAETVAEKVWLGYTGNVAQTLTMTNGSSITVEEGAEVEVANVVVMTDSSLTVGNLNAGTTKAENSSFYFNQLEKGKVYYAVIYDADGNELETIVRTSTSGSTFSPKFSKLPAGKYTVKCFKDEAKTELHQEKTYTFEAIGSMDLTNSDINADKIVLAGNNLVMDYQSTLAFTEISGGTITVKDDGYKSGNYKMFDYVGDGEMTEADYKALLNNLWNEDYLVFNNDLYITDQDLATIYVNTAWSEDELGSTVGNGYIYGYNAVSNFADVAGKIATDGSDTVIKLESDLEAGDVLFNFGSGDITFTADKAVTVKQNVAASDWDFVVGDVNSTITIGKNVTFQINENASGLYVYYGNNLNIEGTLTGGANWGCAYLFQGDHKVAEGGELSTGRVQMGFATLTVNGKLDTNYLLAEESTFTANKATVDAAAIHDSNNGGLRYGASEFSINDSVLTANSVTLKHADTKFNVNGGSFKIAGTFTNGASAAFTKAEGNIGTMDNDGQLKFYESSVTFGTFDNSGKVDFTSAKAIADSATNTGDIKANNTSILFKEFNNAEGTVSVTGGTYLEIGKLTGEINAADATITGSVVGGTLNVTGDVVITKSFVSSVEVAADTTLTVIDEVTFGSLVNNGNVSMTGYDTLTVNGDFATDGMIIVDLSDFSGKNKVLDLNLTGSLEGNANIKFEGKTDDTWISYEDDGDITVIKADMTTLVVDEDFAGASKFDEVEPGLVFGLNAVAKPEDLDWRENTGKVIIRDGVYNAFDIDQNNSVEIVTEAADGEVVELANTNISSDVTVSDIFAVTGDVNVAENALVDVIGTLAIDGEITNAGNIAVADGASFSADLVKNTGSVALKGNVTVDAEIIGGKVTLASDSVLNGDLTADEVVIGYKGAALAADANLSAAVTGGALSIGGNDNTLNIKDGSDSKLIITEDSAFMDDCLGNVFMTGAEGKDITITAVDSAFNGNTVENAKLIITEADGLIKVNTDIANIISINGNELEQIYGVYFYKAGDDFMFVTKTDDNFVAVTNGAGDVEVKTDEIGNFTVKEDYTEFANVNMVMAAGKTTVTVKNGKKIKNEIDYMEFAVGGILKSKKGGSNIVKFGNYNDISIKGDIESIAKLTVGNNSLVNIGGDVKAQNTNSTVTIGKDSIVEIGGDVALAGGKNTMKIGARSSVILGGSLEDVSTFTVAGGKADKRTVFSIGGNFDAADVNNKLTMGNYVDFSVGAVDSVSIDNGGVASATGSTIKLGKESTMTLAGAANGIAKLTVGKNSVVTIGSDNNGLSLGGTEKSNAVSFGDNVRFTATGDIDLAGGKNSLTFGKNNIVTVGDINNMQTIKIGSKSSFEADVISNANAVTVGGESSFTADSLDNVSKFTLAAGKVDAFTQANINGDVVMTGRGDSFKLGSNSKVVVDGEIVMGDGKDTISLGKNSTLQLNAVSGVDVLNATASSTMLFANGKGEDVLLGNVTGSWNKAMIIDEEGELELGFNTGSVYGNEFDCYEVNVDTFKTLTFENISEGVEIQYSYNLNGTWTEWVDYTEDGLKAPGDYRIFVSVSGDYADKYDKLNYSLDAKIA